MRLRSARLIPARFSHVCPEPRGDGWGKLTRLGPQRAELLTRFRVEAGDRVVLSFQAFGETFEDLRAKIIGAPRDGDGYYVAALEFEGPLSRLLLGRVLRDALSRS